jgi:FtsP/CotA-like multicopper oxidase with cupredoxin domain
VSARARIGLLGAAVVVLVVAFVLLRSGGDDSSTTATSGAGPLLTAAKVQEIHVKKGDTVRFRVRSDSAEEVHIHGYDIKHDLPAGKVVPVSFKATIDGIFEIELEHSSTQIARLRVDP